MIASVALGADSEDARLTQYMVIDVELRSQHDTRRLYALLDSGAQANFLSQKVAVEEDFRADSTSIGAMAVDGRSILVYRRYRIETQAVDTLGVSRAAVVGFIATDIKRYNAILEFLWLFDNDPDCYWRTR
jgi:hypothetical protein